MAIFWLLLAVYVWFSVVQKAGAFPAAHAAEAAEAEHETQDEFSPCEMRFGTSVSVLTSARESLISGVLGCRARTSKENLELQSCET